MTRTKEGDANAMQCNLFSSHSVPTITRVRNLVAVEATVYDNGIIPVPSELTMHSSKFHAQMLELIRRTSAYLPPDVSNVIELHRAMEQKGSKADLALELVSQNIGLAKRLSAPICQ